MICCRLLEHRQLLHGEGGGGGGGGGGGHHAIIA